MKRALALGTIGFLGMVAFAFPVRESFAAAVVVGIVVAGIIETQNSR